MKRTGLLKRIPRTSETELHRMGNLLQRHTDQPFYATEKMDGFSFSIGNVGGEFVAAARDRLIVPGEATVFGEALAFLPRFSEDVILQGELCGPGVRNNPHCFDRLDLFAFDLIVDGRPAGLDALQRFTAQHGFKMVPILARDFVPTDDELLRLATFHSGEGAVFRTVAETRDAFQGRVSFKVFNPSYCYHH